MTSDLSSKTRRSADTYLQDPARGEAAREIIENGKPSERAGRKATGAKRRKAQGSPAAMDFDLPH